MAPPARVLLVDDDPDFCEALSDRLRSLGFQVSVADRGSEALRLCREEPPAIVLLDLVLPGMDGMAVLETIRREEPDVVVIVITGHGTIARAVEAMKKGAYDFVSKPVDPRHLEIVLGKALERQALRDANALLSSEVGDRYAAIVGDSSQMRAALDVARRAAPSGATVLLLGESGTGKEVIARAIHRWSRRARPAVRRGQLRGPQRGAARVRAVRPREGRVHGGPPAEARELEVAHGGTVFLDEIGDIRPALQAKLLRVLQDQTFERVGGTRPIQTDVRFVAATNRDLRAEVRDGLFRLDLYYRLDVVSVTLPPLRERAGDVPALAQHFLERYRRELKRELHGITPEALSALRRYAWPGNVRELENVIERAAVLADGPDVTPQDLPAEIREAGLTDGMTREAVRTYHAAVEEFKRGLIASTLRRTSGNRTRAARLLGLQRTYLARLIRDLGLAAPAAVPAVPAGAGGPPIPAHAAAE